MCQPIEAAASFDSSRGFHRTGRDPLSRRMRALPRRPHLDLLDYLPYLINRVGSALVTRFSEDALAGTHLSIATWRVLAVLSNNGGLRQIDLAEMTSTEVSTMSRLVTRLVQMGLVSRPGRRRATASVVGDLRPRRRPCSARSVPWRRWRARRRAVCRTGTGRRSTARCGACTKTLRGGRRQRKRIVARLHVERRRRHAVSMYDSNKTDGGCLTTIPKSCTSTSTPPIRRMCAWSAPRYRTATRRSAARQTRWSMTTSILSLSGSAARDRQRQPHERNKVTIYSASRHCASRAVPRGGIARFYGTQNLQIGSDLREIWKSPHRAREEKRCGKEGFRRADQGGAGGGLGRSAADDLICAAFLSMACHDLGASLPPAGRAGRGRDAT